MFRLVTTRLSSPVGNFITGNRCGSVTGLLVSMVTRCRLDVNYSKRSRLSPKLKITSFTTTTDLISDQKPSFITNTHWITFIVASCIMESIYFSLNNKWIFIIWKRLNLHENTHNCRFYMFRSSTILRELVQSLAKFKLLLKHSVKLRRCIFVDMW